MPIETLLRGNMVLARHAPRFVGPQFSGRSAKITSKYNTPTTGLPSRVFNNQPSDNAMRRNNPAAVMTVGYRTAKQKIAAKSRGSR